MDKLLKQLQEIPNKYKPVPFWSWNNELDPDELRKQIRYMKKSGLGGFFIHARTGLKTPYMGEKWYKCVDACIDEASKLDMDVWLYDENGWPSGFVGGKMLEDEKNLCHYLIMKEEKDFSENALACFVYEDGYKRVKGNVDADKYYNVYDMLDYSNTDILNPEVVDVFISETHEEYKKRYSKYFGNVVKGFFTDEPQFCRTDIPYTSILKENFEKTYNYDPFDYIIYLFNKDEKGFAFRHDYYKLISSLYVNGFIKKIYNWCNENNLKITGHTIDETTFQGQLSCTMGVMPFYEFEHIPGIDWLGRVVDHDMTPRQVGSVANQLGRGQVLTETFALTGWNVTPLQLKHILDFQFLGGANLLCQHLMSYSLKGAGKKDYPPTCGYQIPWTDEYRILNEYATKLGYILANTKDVTDTLILHPIRSGYFYCDKNGCSEEVFAMDADFKETTDKLTNMGIYHHYGDETILERHGKVEGNKFIVGEMTYTNVVVPKMETISSFNLELLNKFIKNGGKVYFFGIPKMVDGKKADLSYLHSNTTLEEIAKQENFEITGDKQDIRFIIKQSNLGKFLFILNKSYTETRKITVKIKAENAHILDIEKLEYFNLESRKDGEFLIFDLEIKGKNSVMIELDREVEKENNNVCCKGEKDVTKEFEIDQNNKNIMTLDTACYSIDGGKTFSGEYYLYAITEKLLKSKFNGPLILRQTFEKQGNCNMSLLVESEKYTSFKVNGKEVKFAKNDIDIFALSADISDKIKDGLNVIEYEIAYYNRDEVRHVLYDDGVKESLKNCLTYDTELESIYLFGNFEVEATRLRKEENNAVITENKFKVVGASKKPVCPLVDNGYPFFSGKISYKGILPKDGASKLKVCGDIMAYDLVINGEKVGKGVFNDEVDIANKLTKDVNNVEIIATISLRNTLGPHHLNIAEPMWASPLSFTMCGTWEDDKNQFYRTTYAFVDSGITNIKLLYAEDEN